MGDGGGSGDEDRDPPPNLLNSRLLRLGVGGESAACLGCCSTEDCAGCESESDCLLAQLSGGSWARFEFESEAERKALNRDLEPFDLFFFWSPMLLCCRR